jgi:hypothetical protein
VPFQLIRQTLWLKATDTSVQVFINAVGDRRGQSPRTDTGDQHCQGIFQGGRITGTELGGE